MSINKLVKEIHENNEKAGWWKDPETDLPLKHHSMFPYVVATKLLLVGTEISEATEGYRKNLMDDKLPHRQMVEVELADAVIRILTLQEL